MALYDFFFQAEDGIRDPLVTGVQTCALPIFHTTKNSEPFHATAGVDPAVAMINGGVALPDGETSDPRTAFALFRSEERRVGKECRSRGSPYDLKEKKIARKTTQVT